MSSLNRVLTFAPLAAFVLAEGAAYAAGDHSDHPARSFAASSPRVARRPAAADAAATRRVEGYAVTMQLSDTAGSVTFQMKVAGDAFSLGLADLLPLLGKGLGNTIGSLADAANLVGGAAVGNATAGAYLLAPDSTNLVLVLPTVNMAVTIDPAAAMAGGFGGFGGRGGRGGPGGGAGGAGFGGPGGRGGANNNNNNNNANPRGAPGGRGGGAAAAVDTTNPRGRGRAVATDSTANARGGRGGRNAPVDSTAMNARGGRAGGGRQFPGAQAAPDPSAAYDTVTRVSVEDLGDGESILGHATHHYRIHTSSSLIPPATCRGAKSADMITDGSFASDISGGAFARFFSLVPMLQGSGVAAPQATSAKDTLPVVLPRGFPMKSVASCDTPTRDPVLTLQVIEIDPATFDPSEFAIPPGLQVINMTNGRGRRGGGEGQ
jgi:hypothetical protein